MEQKNTQGITVKKSENLSEWYAQVIVKAQLADYSPVKGCMIIRPNAYAIWEQIQSYFNERLDTLGVKNAYFPLFIPESFFHKEAEHAKGFSPEVAWIETKDNEERLAVRPTSETIICDSFRQWIRSHRDLPLRINQWANVVRWEVKQTNPFLRSREFLWQEGHCVYETKEEAEKEVKIMLDEYVTLAQDVLALPVIPGRKTDLEKFAGALYTLTFEAFMPDGKALQTGTSHMLDQGFMTSFGVSFKGRDEQIHTPWYISWGFSTRLIGAVIMTHGDDKGLVLPPRIAKHKAVIVPILFKNKEAPVLEKAKALQATLPKEWHVLLDDRMDASTGSKFYEWELQGIPVRIELGPRDLEQGNVTLVRRDTGEKSIVSFDGLKDELEHMFDRIHDSLFSRAKKKLEEHIVIPKTFEDAKKALAENKLVKISWDGTSPTEEAICKETLSSTRCIPFGDEKPSQTTCLYSGKPAKYHVYLSPSY